MYGTRQIPCNQDCSQNNILLSNILYWVFLPNSCITPLMLKVENNLTLYKVLLSICVRRNLYPFKMNIKFEMCYFNVPKVHVRYCCHFVSVVICNNNKHSICTLTSNMYQMTRKLDLKNTCMTKKMYGTRQIPCNQDCSQNNILLSNILLYIVVYF
jgi:hypothetical protein